ncbi:hypothetical protein VTK73DRAFT_1440 [Phialemonium thermophilum]|uniref:SPX domain-containing protein n=1 Tax=Phialemonium thermophilum TaxID=223376 RepID=A0ABR3XA72_9PEZI
MKFGERFEQESVPEWSIHNIDYNSLKHHIKANTTRDQACAIAIPGQQDTSLLQFENELYAELCRQHDRVDLFVSSKAGELSRRLQFLSDRIHHLITRCATSAETARTPKYQRLFAKYDDRLIKCGEEIQALSRFVNAQVVALRKILKKYRKWTGSASLGNRFKENVLSHPKSFTHRRFSDLAVQHAALLTTLRAANPADDSGFESSVEQNRTQPPASRGASRRTPDETPSPGVSSSGDYVRQGYWNEYTCGSEGGDLEDQAEDSYAIYVDPNDEFRIPGIAGFAALLRAPIEKVKTLRRGPSAAEPARRPLLSREGPSYDSIRSSIAPSATGESLLTDTEVEDDLSGRYMYGRQKTLSAFPRADDREAGLFDDAHHMQRALFWATVVAFASSFLLIGIASVVLVAAANSGDDDEPTIELDAGIIFAAVTSLACACAGLSINLSQRSPPRLLPRLAVWLAFGTACVLNGVLLVLIVGRTAL